MLLSMLMSPRSMSMSASKSMSSQSKSCQISSCIQPIAQAVEAPKKTPVAKVAPAP
jgi:hypothetical protein